MDSFLQNSSHSERQNWVLTKELQGAEWHQSGSYRWLPGLLNLSTLCCSYNPDLRKLLLLPSLKDISPSQFWNLKTQH